MAAELPLKVLADGQRADVGDAAAAAVGRVAADGAGVDRQPCRRCRCRRLPSRQAELPLMVLALIVSVPIVEDPAAAVGRPSCR